MAYGAFAKVDPRLLAQDFGADRSASIAAAGDAIEKIGNIIVSAKKEGEQKEKEAEDREYTMKRRGQMDQLFAMDVQIKQGQVADIERQNEFRKGDLQNNGKIPNLFTVEENTTNLATSIKGIEPTPKSDSTPTVEGTDIKTDTEIQSSYTNYSNGSTVKSPDGTEYTMNNKLNLSAIPPNLPNKVVDKVMARAGVLTNASIGLQTALEDLDITKGGNERLWKIKDSNLVQVWNPNSKTNQLAAAYTNTDTGEIEMIPLSDHEIANGGKLLLESQQPNMTEARVFTSNTFTSKFYNKTLTKEPMLQQDYDNLERGLNETFSKPSAVDNYIELNNITDLTGDDVVNAKDAVAYAMGVGQGLATDREVRKADLTPDEVQEAVETRVRNIDAEVQIEYQAGNAQYFRDLGYKEATFDKDGAMTYVEPYTTTEGKAANKLVTFTPTPTEFHKVGRQAIYKNYGSGKERTALASAHTQLTPKIKQEQDAAIEAARLKKVEDDKKNFNETQRRIVSFTPKQLQNVFNHSAGGSAKIDPTTLEGIAGIKTVDKDTIGDEFTIHFDDGSELRVNPDNLEDIKKIHALTSEYKFKEEPAIPKANPKMKDSAL